MAKMATKKTKTALNKNLASKGAVKTTKKVKHHSTMKKVHAKSTDMVTNLKSDTACADAKKSATNTATHDAY